MSRFSYALSSSRGRSSSLATISSRLIISARQLLVSSTALLPQRKERTKKGAGSPAVTAFSPDANL